MRNAWISVFERMRIEVTLVSSSFGHPQKIDIAACEGTPETFAVFAIVVRARSPDIELCRTQVMSIAPDKLVSEDMC